MKKWGLLLVLSTPGSWPAWSQGTTWSIVVGIDEYVKPSIPKLRYAVADAQLFAQSLLDVLKVPAENLFVMTSNAADANSLPRVVNLAYRLGWLDERVSKDDTVIFYFAGHGVTVEGQPFLLTEEADNRSAATLRASAMHGGEVIRALRKIDCARVWVVLDTCRNSPGAKAENRLEGDLAGAFSHADVGREQSATMFSCNVGERAWESDELQHGLYTYYLVEGLGRRAADITGRITLQGLHDYSANQTKEASKKLGSVQHPRLFYGGPSSNQWVLSQVQPAITSPHIGILTIFNSNDPFSLRLHRQLVNLLKEKRSEGHFSGAGISARFGAYDVALPSHAASLQKLGLDRVESPYISLVELDADGQMPTKIIWHSAYESADQALKLVNKQLGVTP